MSDGSVKVDPEDLLAYGQTLATSMADAQSGIAEPVTAISTHANSAFTQPVVGTRPFYEGISTQKIIQRNLSDYHDFLTDVRTGLEAIMSASTAISVAYMRTDDDSAIDLNAVGFAFADGSGAPKDFPTKGISTMSDEQAKADALSGRNTEAAMAADNPDMLQYATKTAVDGGFMYTFADGSRLAITSATTGSMFISDTSSSKSVYKPGDKKPSSVITTGESYDYSGQKTQSKTTMTLGDDGKYVTSTSSTTNLSGGGVNVTSTTYDGDGKTTQHTDTTVVPNKTEPDHGDDTGPLQQREKQYNSQGSGKKGLN